MGYPAEHPYSPFSLPSKHLLERNGCCPHSFQPSAYCMYLYMACPGRQRPLVCHAQTLKKSPPPGSASHIHLLPTPSLPESGRRTTSVRAQEAIRKNGLHWLLHKRTPYYVPTLVVWSITPAPKYPQPPQLVIVGMRVLSLCASITLASSRSPTCRVSLISTILLLMRFVK